MPSRSYYRLYNLRHDVGGTASGNLVFQEIREAQPRLLNWPVDVTDAIPVTLSPGTVTEIYLYDSASVVLGDSMQLSIAMSGVATYRDANGNLQSAFSQDVSVIRAISIHDLVARYPEGIQVLTGSEVVW
jgi:HK97 family phage major capsid protein